MCLFIYLFICIIINVDVSQICAKEMTDRITYQSVSLLSYGYGFCFVPEQNIHNIGKTIKLPCFLPYKCEFLIRVTYKVVTNISMECVLPKCSNVLSVGYAYSLIH